MLSIRKSVRASAALIAVALSLTFAPAASASVEAASVTPYNTILVQGSHSCGADQKVRLIVTLNSAGTVYFDEYKSGRWVTVGSQYASTTAVHTYASRTVTWKVISNDIAHVQEACA